VSGSSCNETWGGRPVARRAADAGPRHRVVITGTITRCRTRSVHGVPSLCCTLDDGTGDLDLLFLGRPAVPGIGVGARCHARGTAQYEHGRLVVWNPWYQIEAR